MERVERGSVDLEQIPNGLGWLNPAAYGTIGAGSDQVAINRAILRANEAGGGVVYLSESTYTISGSINLRSNVTVRGAGRNKTIIRGASGVSIGVFLAGSGALAANVEICDLTVDGGFSSGLLLNGVRITNGTRPNIHDCRFTNIGRAGVLLQGTGANTGTPFASITDNIFDGIGLENLTIGFGIQFKDSSSDGIASRNVLTNVVGGMGIGGSGTVSTGYPLRLRIADNTIQMSPSTTGFEAIGIQDGCEWAVISGNTIIDSQDNGISCSAGHCSVVNNTVNGTQNHGIYTNSPYTTIIGNVIRNIGRDEAFDTYGGVTINTTEHCIAIGNTINDDQVTPTTGYAVKISSSLGNNLVAFNKAVGMIHPELYGDGYLSSDVLIETDTDPDSVTIRSLAVDTIVPAAGSTQYILGGDVRFSGRGYVGSVTSPAQGQFNIRTNTVGRYALGIKAIASQTADLLAVEDIDANRIASITIAGQGRFASLGVGNATTASIPGTVVRKIQVFDQSGASLGFIAIYSSIA